MVILTTISCFNNKTNPEKCTDEEVDTWFDKQEWLADWDIQPSASINKKF